ncbi:transcriptional regulator [Bacillus sp. AFS018417]|uniref:HTH-type transcriptional regulator YwnA n=1 Tax=Bacillus rhizoplanae TaxID=2880966 RepID=A0ABN7ZW72_9BACI|nr:MULTISPECIES: Rrf2 family transcriptional regulator [Bacillus]MCP1125390.1 Rrf2 family transcriptional regulator [Bacillus sp. 3103sda1]PEZ10435.1 transcriptional regulator [Bacillus sp. AFS018417]CAG9611524.1 Putative HTH-type transcriptional regulator YwnA [Bacillus rhizoplanae]
MGISSRFTVAVHMLTLLEVDKKSRCTSEWIAGSVNTNPVVIRRITGMLKKAGLVDVQAGKGGTSLARDLNEVTLLDVYKAVEVVEEGHLFSFHDNPNVECPVGANIQTVLEIILLQAQDAMENVLANVKVKQLVTNLEEKIQQ